MRVTIREISESLLPGEEKRSEDISASDDIIDILLTDSRSVTRPSSSLFFAIHTVGGNDGHDYIEELYQKGVRNFIVEYSPPFLAEKKDVNVIYVKNSVSALQKIASSFKNSDTEYVAIAGSRGKTTVKEYIYQLLEPLRRISRSPRSFNSQIGVPVSLWQVDRDSEIALIEAGISKRGEMKLLAECINPDTVIFTNIADDHFEGFTEINEKAAEKSLLASGENVKTIIYNADSELLNRALSPYFQNKKVIGFSFEDKNASLYINLISFSKGAAQISFIWNNKEHHLNLPAEDEIDLENFAAAIAFILSENVEPAILQERFKSLHKSGTRLNVTEGVNGCIIVQDSYVNDATSLPPAIDFMMRRKTPEQRSVVIMSDLYRKDLKNDIDYRRIGEILKENGVDKFIGVGEEIAGKREFFPESSEFYISETEFLSLRSPSDFVNEIILLRNSGAQSLRAINEMLEARTHETVLEVDLGSLTSNYKYFKSKIPGSVGIIAMVKAFGYGAGSYEIAKTLQDCGASYLAVAVVDEGVDLRKNGIVMPIMVMNPKVVDYGALFENKLEPEIYSFEMLKEIISEARKRNIKEYPVHIKIDTGMHRMGFIESEIDLLTDIINSDEEIKISSIFSHLATADCLEMDDYTFRQLYMFEEMTEKIMARLPYKVKRHILNSAGILRFPEYHYDMVRLGIGLYGANTLPPDIEKPLEVVSTLRTVIIALREWEAGETIGYGRRGMLKRKSRIATIPIGYADGMNRHFGNGRLTVKVNGMNVPTIGNICMDACMLDVTDVECKVGDSVEIFGKNNPLQLLADTLDTIPYEILTSVSPRVRRIYYRE